MGLAAYNRMRRLKAQKEAKSKEQPEVPNQSLKDLTLPQLKEKAKGLGLSGYSKLKEDELIALIEGAHND